MSEPPFLLRTLERPALLGPEGPVVLTDPRALALLVMLALAGEEGVPEDTLLLRLTPELTPARGRGLLKDLGDTLAGVLGPMVIQRDHTTLRLTPGTVRLDVRRGDPSATGTGAPGFLLGAALPDSPEFLEWLDDTRRRVVPVRQPVARRLPAPVGIGAAVLIVAALAWWAASTRPSTASRFPPGAMVVLADVDNATGDTLFDAGLNEAATIALEQSGYVGLLSRERIRDALARAQLSLDSARLSLDRAREAAVREGVRFLIVPRIASEGAGYRVSAVLVDAAEDRLVREASTLAEGRAGVLPALDRVLGEIRGTLGEQASALEAGAPLPQVATPSLEALRSFGLGTRAWRQGDYELAQAYWHRALDQDTGFAMAYAAIARGHALGHNRDSARYYYSHALARRDRMTDYERLRLEELIAADRGDRDSSVRIAAAVAARFPNAGNFYNYGTALMQADRCNEAVAPFERSLALDSTFAQTHVNLATCARRASSAAQAIRHYERAAAISAPIALRGNPGYEFGGVLASVGLVDSAGRQFGRMLEQPGLFDRTLGHRGLGFLALQQGRDAEAAGHFEATIEIGKQQRAALSLVRGYLFVAMARTLGGDERAAGTAFAEMLDIIRTRPLVPQILALAGWGLVRAGRLNDAEAVLRRLRDQSNRSEDDRAAEAFLAGAVALLRGEPRSADSAFRSAPSFVQPGLEDLLHADALEALGQTDSAAALRTRLVNRIVFGSETQIEWIRRQRSVSGRTPTGRR